MDVCRVHLALHHRMGKETTSGRPAVHTRSTIPGAASDNEDTVGNRLRHSDDMRGNAATPRGPEEGIPPPRSVEKPHRAFLWDGGSNKEAVLEDRTARPATSRRLG